MSAHVLVNLLNELRKHDKMRGLPRILSFFATSLINSIIQSTNVRFYNVSSCLLKIRILYTTFKTCV